LKKLKISEYEELTGIPNRTIRNKIATGELPSSREKIDNRRLTVIHIDDDEFEKLLASQPLRQSGESASQKNNSESPMANQSKEHGENYQEAEIIDDTEDYKPQYNLVSMETETFENLIQNIKDLSDDRHETEKEAYKKLEEQYFKANQEASEWRAKAEEYRLESVQAVADKKINEIRIKELEEKIAYLEKELKKAQSLWGFFQKST
jgi:BRCT domain type II-containing protein